MMPFRSINRGQLKHFSLISLASKLELVPRNRRRTLTLFQTPSKIPSQTADLHELPKQKEFPCFLSIIPTVQPFRRNASLGPGMRVPPPRHYRRHAVLGLLHLPAPNHGLVSGKKVTLKTDTARPLVHRSQGSQGLSGSISDLSVWSSN
jgi:hypothetical protein